jgi:hypothetical protein
LIYLKDAFENAQILAPQAGRKSDPPGAFFAWPRPKPMKDRSPSIVVLCSSGRVSVMHWGPGNELEDAGHSDA